MLLELEANEMHAPAGVAFRPHHPWELLSASMDASLIRWSFASGRALRRWDMAAPGEQTAGSQVPCAVLLFQTAHQLDEYLMSKLPDESITCPALAGLQPAAGARARSGRLPGRAAAAGAPGGRCARRRRRGAL